MVRVSQDASASGPQLTAAGEGDKIRLDRWLVHVRLFKTRTLAVARIEGGGIRLNGQPCRKPSQLLRHGDVLTVPVPGCVRSLRVRAAGLRRGPPSEARELYDDLDEISRDQSPVPSGGRVKSDDPGSGAA